jgi:chloride channel protein, CIC family
VPATSEYAVDPLAHVHVSDIASKQVRMMRHDQTAGDALAKIAAGNLHHQGYPVVEGEKLIGVVTRTQLLAAEPEHHLASLIQREPLTITRRETARAAASRMAHADVGRIVVVDDKGRPIGIVTRSDLIAAFARARR